MTDERKQEIKERIMSIVNNFEPTEEEPELSIFILVSKYNEQYENPELIGGKWIRENMPELKDLP